MKLYYPDSLLNQLQNAGVTHILTANLRRNSTQKDGLLSILSNVTWHLSRKNILMIFTKVSQVGDDNNEPATIVKIEYEKYGRSVKKPGKK